MSPSTTTTGYEEEMEKRRRGGLSLVWISIILLILMVISPPISHTFTGGREIAEGGYDQYKSKQAEMDVENSRRGYSYSDGSVGEECESERQVPTGSDPLHHNSYPSP